MIITKYINDLQNSENDKILYHVFLYIIKDFFYDIIIFDNNDNIIFKNKSFYKNNNIKYKKSKNISIQTIFTKDSYKKIINNIKKIKNNKIKRIEFKAELISEKNIINLCVLLKKCKVFKKDFYILLIKNNKFGINYINSFLRDISPGKEIEDKLFILERNLSNLYNNMQDGISTVNKNGRIIKFNKSFQKMLGYNKKEIFNLTYKDITPKKWHEFENKIFHEQVLIKGYSDMYEKEYQKKNGIIFPVELRTYYIPDKNNHNKGFWTAIVRDITQRKKAEAILRESEEIYRAIFKSSSDAIVLLNKKGFFDCNDVTIKLFGAKRKKDIIYKHPADFSPIKQPDGSASLTYSNKKIKEAYNKGICKFEWIHRKKNGEEFYAEVLFTSFLLYGEKVIQGTIRDITENKLAEEKLRKSEETIKLKLEFQNVISKISSRFVGIINIDDAINESLADIGKLSNASRSYLFVFNENNTLMENSHEWCNIGITPKISYFKNFPTSKINWWMKQLHKGEVIYIKDIYNLNDSANAEKSILSKHNVKAILVYPLYTGGKLYGFIGFDNNIEKVHWKEEDFTLLRISAEIFGNALELKRVEKKALELYKHLGVINRRIAILKDLKKEDYKKNKNEFLNLITKSAQNISQARIILLYKYIKSSSSFKLLSFGGRLIKKQKEDITLLKANSSIYLKELIKSKIRIQGVYSSKLDNINIPLIKSFIFFPIIEYNKLQGTIFFGFSIKENISTQELDFYELFVMHISSLLKSEL